MAMPIYTDEIAHVEARGSIMLLTLRCAGKTVQVAMTRHTANSISEGIQSCASEEAPVAEVLRFGKQQ